MLLVKKYGNRRIYDTGESRYITLEELEEKIRLGVDVRVVDAKTGTDLTQSTLAQIILESRGAAALLPVPLLTQMVRMGDDLLIEFLTRYLASALELYVQAKQGAQALTPLNPLMALPFNAGNAFARLFGAGGNMPAPTQRPPRDPAVDDLWRELAELKASLQPDRRRTKKRRRR